MIRDDILLPMDFILYRKRTIFDWFKAIRTYGFKEQSGMPTRVGIVTMIHGNIFVADINGSGFHLRPLKDVAGYATHLSRHYMFSSIYDANMAQSKMMADYGNKVMTRSAKLLRGSTDACYAYLTSVYGGVAFPDNYSKHVDIKKLFFTKNLGFVNIELGV